MRKNGYVVYADNWARANATPAGDRRHRTPLGAWNYAKQTALIGNNRGDAVRIYPASAGPLFLPGTHLGTVRSSGGRLRLSLNAKPRPPRGALGDTLTDWACSSTAFAQDWRNRVATSISTGAIATIIGAGAAGLLGGLLRRPLLGAALGAATGWAAYAIWTAPIAASAQP